MKIQLELIIHEEPDNRRFLNYWDFRGGDDVCCEVIDGKLMKSNRDENGDDLPDTEISIKEFIELVNERA